MTKINKYPRYITPRMNKIAVATHPPAASPTATCTSTTSVLTATHVKRREDLTVGVRITSKTATVILATQ
jgi:hypothetical protein